MKPGLALEPVHWQGEVGTSRKFDSRHLLLDAPVGDSGAFVY